MATKRKDLVACTPFQLATLAVQVLARRPGFTTRQDIEQAIQAAWSLLKASRDFLEETPNKANAWD